jgi:hypothetical protein
MRVCSSSLATLSLSSSSLVGQSDRDRGGRLLYIVSILGLLSLCGVWSYATEQGSSDASERRRRACGGHLQGGIGMVSLVASLDPRSAALQ